MIILRESEAATSNDHAPLGDETHTACTQCVFLIGDKQTVVWSTSYARMYWPIVVRWSSATTLAGILSLSLSLLVALTVPVTWLGHIGN